MMKGESLNEYCKSNYNSYEKSELFIWMLNNNIDVNLDDVIKVCCDVQKFGIALYKNYVFFTELKNLYSFHKNLKRKSTIENIMSILLLTDQERSLLESERINNNMIKPKYISLSNSKDMFVIEF